MVAVIVLAALALLLFVFVASGVRIVRPFQRGIVERLGRYKETVDPGLRIIIPFIEHLRLVDMREQVVDVPPQEVITKDNVVVSVDAVVYYEPTDRATARVQRGQLHARGDEARADELAQPRR